MIAKASLINLSSDIMMDTADRGNNVANAKYFTLLSCISVIYHMEL